MQLIYHIGFFYLLFFWQLHRLEQSHFASVSINRVSKGILKLVLMLQNAFSFAQCHPLSSRGSSPVFCGSVEQVSLDSENEKSEPETELSAWSARLRTHADATAASRFDKSSAASLLPPCLLGVMFCLLPWQLCKPFEMRLGQDLLRFPLLAALAACSPPSPTPA